MKKYLFFDIECSNCFGDIGKICEFGYVITDENFNILTCDDIPMSPGDKNDRWCRFDETIYKREPGFKYAYTNEEYFSFKKFPHFYKRIKELLTNDQYIVFGYAVDNDVSYLGSDISRYKLPKFDYVAYDIQPLAHKVLETPKARPGLEKTFIKLYGVNEKVKLQSHMPMDDAKMTMLILRELCHQTGKSPMQLVSECENSKINVLDFLEERRQSKIRKAQEQKVRAIRKANHKAWEAFCEEHQVEGAKRVTISAGVQSSDELTKRCMDNVIKNNFTAVCRPIDVAAFVVANDEERNKLVESFKWAKDLTILTVDEFDCFK